MEWWVVSLYRVVAQNGLSIARKASLFCAAKIRLPVRGTLPNGECRFYVDAIMSGNETQKQAIVYSQSPEANKLFLKAREFFNKRDPRTGGALANAREAIGLYEQAVKADPKFALAFVELSRAWMTLGYSDPDGISNKELLPHAKAAALKAVALDQKMTDAHLALGGIYYSIEFDWEKAEREFKLAIQLAPNSADAHSSYASYLGAMGRFDEALAEAKKADELMPSQDADFVLARIHYDMHGYDEATAYLKRSLKEKGNMLGHFLLGFVYVAQQKYDEAIAEFKIDVGNNAGALAALAYAYAMGGRKDEALKMLNDLEANHPGAKIVPYRIAAIYLALGDIDQAIELLKKDYEVQNNWMNQLKVDPVMDPLRSDPRFQVLLRKMKFKE